MGGVAVINAERLEGLWVQRRWGFTQRTGISQRAQGDYTYKDKGYFYAEAQRGIFAEFQKEFNAESAEGL